ncbi:bifunctional indole-3-glycerol-phosphate synthase TrpC/phosphoribosylanthranilate isomerase TrpF [Thalassotalea sp. LPB0316]|uniref:bifunctional indole-3-glycerol-phosphate synthase TrpC/phosphoribosylanthranilate isomerase TrpF n=1 Tax=Thalassotalea sp. LPB0316 TaxID=2769490 RepID=UPI00186833E3|nr:bifunctional indole-3-glycerol-phosphate synthase TrpC/phosphoribosylanthranilate isomerase TrpF [Thalassotalea sp. LPB0316]QOL24675.1 bifunctional indole-3-glycerol-phosphate synthase TrpC/phosphoribosylanthranilate isomerase TrpF [Thalassotalea sp. LPB0316]
MANILEKIVEDKRAFMATYKQENPLEDFIGSLTPSTKDLYASLSQPEAGFILECKKASPSKGLIRDDFNVLDICRIYDKYAAGISVLTDEKYFQGKYEYLKTVCETVDCPVLNKDFFFEPYQVYLARHLGADAILLMLSVLTDQEYIELAKIAERYQMAILTEISNTEEMARAIKLNAKLIGINNRNLRDLSTDISRTFDYAPHLPDGTLVISESGIYTNAQVRELAPAVDGFLVGSSIMAQADIDLACRQLIFGENKVCGLTSPESASAVLANGGVYGGLIFAEKSPRFVSEAMAKTITEQVSGLNYVGVFVNHEIETVAALANTLNLFAVQLHGSENDAYINELRKSLPVNTQIWQAVSVKDHNFSLSANPNISRFILDNKQGGSGEQFDWQALHQSELDLTKCMLAGGLNCENISTAIDTMNNLDLLGLDINSGVESSPGHKCSAMIAAVFKNIRNY